MELVYKDTGGLPAGRQERIDIWLTKQFPYTRSFFHHIISRGGILVKNKPIKKSYQLKNNDEIKVDDLQRYLGSEILEETPNVDIPIILEKDDYLVINKPKGVLSHPRNLRELQEPSVVGFLYHRYKKLPSIGNFIRAGLIHRLDKETDGLMIIAKTEKGLAHFKQLFDEKSQKAEEIWRGTGDLEKSRIMNSHIPSKISQSPQKSPNPLKKFYKAVSHLTPEGELFLNNIKDFPYTINEPVIAKVPFTTPKIGITKILAVQPISDEGGVTSSEGRVTSNSTLVKISLEILTGRTHQIRYHLSHHGLPIIGDYLYGKDEGVPMQLKAYKLIFQDPEGEMQTIEI